MIVPLAGYSQKEQTSRYTLNIGLGIEKVGLPFRKVIDFPIHSSYHLGIERRWSDLSEKKAFQCLEVAVFTNSSAGSGYLLHTSCGTKIDIIKAFYFSPSAGIGLLHLFRPKESFVLENGESVLSKDRGNFYPEVLLNLKLGYQLNRMGFFGSYQTGIQFGYDDDINMLPRTFLTLGVRYEI